MLVQLQPSLALQTLDYFKAMRDFDAAAGLSSSSDKTVPLKQVRQQPLAGISNSSAVVVHLICSTSCFCLLYIDPAAPGHACQNLAFLCAC